MPKRERVAQPMLAPSKQLPESYFRALQYPIYASGKLDGVRCTIIGGKALTRSLKPIGNDHTREWLEAVLPEGADGELIDPNTNFNATSGAVRRQSGQPNLQFYWFDTMPADPAASFLARQEASRKVHAALKDPRVIFWDSVPILDYETLLRFEEGCLKMGLEGVMVRNNGIYKFGRCTANEGYLVKLKRFEDAEATVVELVEQLANNNDVEVDELGHTKRSGHKANKTGKGTMGAMILRDIETGVEFRCGNGWDQKTAQAMWNERESWVGRIVKYKWQESGKKDKPRFSTFLGERSPDDM